MLLVDEALAGSRRGRQLRRIGCRACARSERAELRAEAGERVTQFLECWPALQEDVAPSTEVLIRQELHGGKVVLQGKVDLTIGAPDGLVAGKVLIDLKTGAARPVHFDDLRFYALVETMRLGTPPLRSPATTSTRARCTPRMSPKRCSNPPQAASSMAS